MKESIMWRYIAQEAAVLEELLHSNRVGNTVSKIGTNIEAIYFVCHGSSYNAAMVVLDFISRHTGIRAYAMTPANFLYTGSTITQENRNTVLVATISQTGTSRGCIEALRHANELGFRTLGITDIDGSPVAKEAQICLNIGCGLEESNAKTKGYSATILLLLLLAMELGTAKGTLDAYTYQLLYEELRTSIQKIPESIDEIRLWCQKQNFGKGMKDVYVLGYGMNFGTAQEGQLKLMETMCIPTMFNDIEEFSHGMHRSITEESTLILLKTEHPLAELTEKTFQYLQRKTSHVYLLDASANQQQSTARLNLPYLPNTHSVLLLTLAIQIFSVFAPENNGHDPNQDANNDYTDFVHTRI